MLFILFAGLFACCATQIIARMYEKKKLRAKREAEIRRRREIARASWESILAAQPSEVQ